MNNVNLHEHELSSHIIQDRHTHKEVIVPMNTEQNLNIARKLHNTTLYTISAVVIIFMCYIIFYFYQEYNHVDRDTSHVVEQAKRTTTSLPKGHMVESSIVKNQYFNNNHVPKMRRRR